MDPASTIDGCATRPVGPASATAATTARATIAPLRDEDKTPLVLFLLSVIHEQDQRLHEQDQRLHEQDQRLAALEADLARLRRPKPPASNSQPSALSQPAVPPPTPDGKRPGSAKRSKTKDLPIHEEVAVPPKELPPGAVFVRRDPFVVQDLRVEPRNTRYWLETWQTPTGETLRGELPAGVRGHFGPGLVGFALQQHYAAHVPQSRLLEEL